MSIRRGTTRFLKWATPALALLILCVWGFSGERLFKLNGPGESWAAISGGRMWISLDSPPIAEEHKTPTGVYLRHTPFSWWFDGAWGRGDIWFAVPLWVMVVGCAGLAALGWRADAYRRGAVGRRVCETCGYDRSGLLSAAVCPECGTAEARG